MLHHSKSRERASIGGPSYMNNDQVASYLQDLRQNRPQRPAGARPSPFAPRISKGTTSPSPERPSLETTTADPPHSDPPQASNVTPSHTRSYSAAPTFLGRPLVRAPSRIASPAATQESSTARTNSPQPVRYMPDGRRWMEQQEASSLRRALEDMDLAEEARIHNAAQSEASELVWKHQNPDAPYKYRDHLRKGSYNRTHSLGGLTAPDQAPIAASTAHDPPQGTRQIPGGSSKISSETTSEKPTDSDTADEKTDSAQLSEEDDSRPAQRHTPSQEDPAKIKFAASFFGHTSRRASGGSNRRVSGQSIKGTFSNPHDRIYEEPQKSSPKPPASSTFGPSPVPERRNPFARLRSSRSNVSSPARSNTAPLPSVQSPHRIEIQKNPPSQSRNPDYVENEPLFSFNATAKLPPPGESNEDLMRTRDGKEIRSEDIRAATSKRLSDRSARLPTPVLVSDKPGRPIVSFKDQRQIHLKEEVATTQAEAPVAPLSIEQPNLSEGLPPPLPTTQTTSPAIPPAVTPSKPPSTFTNYTASRPSSTSKTSASPRPSSTLPDSPTVPIITVGASPVPSITLNEVAPVIPTIAINDGASSAVPVIALNDAPPPPIPSISVKVEESRPSITINAPAIPTISISGGTSPVAPPTAPPTRPLPTPTKRNTNSQTSSQPRTLRHQTKHMSLAGPPRTSVLCTACALPIAGRIVSAAGSRFHPECFRCHHCSEALECVAFYPEPDNARSARIERIRRRTNNEYVRAHDHSSEAEDQALEDKDGWIEDARFYCHLDFHEFFSPRCKSCKTPIEGEVIVACGAEWHVGHFFCAQCGDPFDPSIPFVEKDGYAWCVNCHTNRVSTKCKKCRKPVVDTVVKALGSEWHESCFCCVECGGGFADGRYFLRPGGSGSDPVCVRCEDRRLKAY